MKAKLFIALLTTVFITSSFFLGVGSSIASNTPVQKYLIAFQKNLPSGYIDVIATAGGTVLRAMPEIGGLEVASSSNSFLDNLKGVQGIQGANVELVQKLDSGLTDPTAADGLPVTDIPQNASSYWQYQWDIQRITNSGATYNIESGGIVVGSNVQHKAVVGIIDTGIDAKHPDLKANLLGGMNFVPAGTDSTETGDPADIVDREGHGTHVAGSIAGNGKIKGVGPNLGFRAYRVFPGGQGAPTSWIVAAIIQASNDKVDVINMSLGGFDAISRYTYQGNSYNDVADILLWKRAIQYAVNHNVTVVAAAGNESLNLNSPHDIMNYMNEQYGYLGLVFRGAAREVPGQIPGVITVSSSIQWSTDQIAFYSNYGSRTIDVSAPGGDNGPLYASTRNLKQRDFHYRALSTWPTYLPSYFTSNLTGYALLHGTSMAAPKVAGIAAVIKAAHPDYSPAQVTAVIQKTALDYGKPGQDALFGSGEANLFSALTSK